MLGGVPPALASGRNKKFSLEGADFHKLHLVAKRKDDKKSRRLAIFHSSQINTRKINFEMKYSNFDSSEEWKKVSVIGQIVIGTGLRQNISSKDLLCKAD